VTQVVERTFAIKPGTEAGTRQIAVYEGSTGGDIPVVDHVVDLSFEYFGIADPAGTEVAEEGSNLVWLSPERLSDGDRWRPDADAPSRFDADLLRIRAVDVTVRVEAALDALRGPAGALFARTGTARHGRRLLPDRQMRFRVSPPNLGLVP